MPYNQTCMFYSQNHDYCKNSNSKASYVRFVIEVECLLEKFSLEDLLFEG